MKSGAVEEEEVADMQEVSFGLIIYGRVALLKGAFVPWRQISLHNAKQDLKTNMIGNWSVMGSKVAFK